MAAFEAGIQDMRTLDLAETLTDLNLHANQIERIQNLHHLTSLASLNLSSNRITRIENLHNCGSLTCIDLSCNQITAIDGLAALTNLRKLLISYNRIESIAGLVQCHGCPIEVFEAYGNQISLLREAEYFVGLNALTEVTLQRHGQSNPVCLEPRYRQRVIELLPRLKILDGTTTDKVCVDFPPPAASPDKSNIEYECATRAQPSNIDSQSIGLPAAKTAGSSVQVGQDTTGNFPSNQELPFPAEYSMESRPTPLIDNAMNRYFARRLARADKSASISDAAVTAGHSATGETAANMTSSQAQDNVPSVRELLSTLSHEIRIERLESTLNLWDVENARRRGVGESNEPSTESYASKKETRVATRPGSSKPQDNSKPKRAVVAGRRNARTEDDHREGESPSVAINAEASRRAPKGHNLRERSQVHTLEARGHRICRVPKPTVLEVIEDAVEMEVSSGGLDDPPADSATSEKSFLIPTVAALVQHDESFKSQCGSAANSSQVEEIPTVEEEEEFSIRAELARLRKALEAAELEIRTLSARQGEDACAADVPDPPKISLGRTEDPSIDDPSTSTENKPARKPLSVHDVVTEKASAPATALASESALDAELSMTRRPREDARFAISNLEQELTAMRHELDMSSHAARILRERELKAREALSSLGELSSSRISRVEKDLATERESHAETRAQLEAAQKEISNLDASLQTKDGATRTAIEELRSARDAAERRAAKAERLVAESAEASSTNELALFEERRAAHSYASQAESRENDLRAQVENLKAQLSAQEAITREAQERECHNEARINLEVEQARSEAAQARERARTSLEEVEPLRRKLVDAVQKEVAARGAAHEMAELLREQRARRAAVEARRQEIEAELASERQRVAREKHEMAVAAAAAESAHKSELAKLEAEITQQELNAAKAAQVAEEARLAFASEKDILLHSHAEALRIKDVIQRETNAHLSQAKEQLVAESSARKEAEECTASSARCAEELAATREALIKRDSKIGRLEDALVELEAAKSNAEAEARDSKELAAKREGMLAFVEKEVETVKALFAEKERAVLAESNQRLADRESEVSRLVSERESFTKHMQEAESALRDRIGALEQALREEEGSKIEALSSKKSLSKELRGREEELERALHRVNEVEEEMRIVLKAMEAQRQKASRDASDLARIVDSWRTAGPNTPAASSLLSTASKMSGPG